MENITAEIFAALENWKLDQARALLERNSHLLSDTDYALAMDRLYDRTDVNRLLNDLNNHVENGDYVAALQTLEDIQVNEWAKSHPDYEHLKERYRFFQNDHSQGLLRGWVSEIEKYLTDEDGELDLDKARRQLADVDVLLQKIKLLPESLRKDFEPQIHRKVLEYEKKHKEAQAIDNIERAYKAEFFAEAQKLLVEAKAAGVSENKLQELQEKIENNQKRAEGQSITFLNDPTKSDVERIEGASVSAKSAKAWRLAYNLAYHGYITLGEPDSNRLFEEALEYKQTYLEQLPKDIEQQIKVSEYKFELGEYEEAKQALSWAKKFGMSPGKFDGKIDDYMDSIVIKGNPLNEISVGADLATRIADLEPKIQQGIENRRKARELYARAGMLMTSGTFSRIANAIDLLLQSLAVDERYQDAQTLLLNLSQQYTGSFSKIFEDKCARFDASIQDGAWGRAERYWNDIKNLKEEAKEFVKKYPQGLADKNPLNAISLDQYADDISQRESSLEQLKSREKSANEKREILMQTFNAARNNLDQSRQNDIERLLQEWSSLTLRKMDVKRVRQQVQAFWDQEYQWLSDTVRKIQEATNKGAFDSMQVLETTASELESKAQDVPVLKVEQSLADYYGKLGALKRRDDPLGAVDYYIKAEQHAKIANNAASSATYRKALEDLKVEFKDKSAIIDTRRALQNALNDKNYEEIEQILVELPEDVKNDIEIKQLGKKAKVALARFQHDRFLEECRLILSIQPRAGEKGEFIPAKERDFEYARDLAVKALGHYATSPDASNMRDLAIRYQAKENEGGEELETYIGSENYPAAQGLATDFLDQKYPYIGAKLWKKCIEAQNLYRKWNQDNQDKWETAKDNAKAMIDRIDLGDDNADSVFAQAQMMLEKCKSTYWRPDEKESFEKVVDTYIVFPRNAFSEASKQYAQIKRSLVTGEISHAYDLVDSFPSGIPAQVEKSRTTLRNHLAKLNQSFTTLIDELVAAKKSLLFTMGGQSAGHVRDGQPNLLRLKNGIDFESISEAYISLNNAAEAAKRFEGFLGVHDDTKELLGDENSKQTKEGKSDEISLFGSPILRKFKRFREEEDKYKYLKSLALFLRKDFESLIRNYKINDVQERLEELSHACPSMLADLGGGFRTLSQWLEEREIVYNEMEVIKYKIANSFLPLSKPDLIETLKSLEKLDGKTLEEYQDNRYREINSTGPDAKIETHITDWERKRIRDLRNMIKSKLESFWSRKVVVFFGTSLVLLLFAVFGGIAYANRPVPMPTATPTEIKLTFTPTAPQPTLVPTAVFTPTPLPFISGRTIGQTYVFRFPSSDETVPIPGNVKTRGYLGPDQDVTIVRYCVDNSQDMWLALGLGEHYGWMKLYSPANNPLVSIGDNKTNPEIRISSSYEVVCPYSRESPIPGVPPPACGYWDCDYDD